jgi:hypothetical protein
MRPHFAVIIVTMSVLSGKPKSLAFEKAEEHESLEGVHGRIFVWRLSPRIYASQVEGYLDRAMAQLIIDIAEPLYGKGCGLGLSHLVRHDGLTRLQVASI